MQEYGQEYGDEGFIQILKERLETAWNRDITQGAVRIQETELEFDEYELIDEQLWMWVPDEFELLEQELAEMKYPDENRPDRIYSSGDGTVNISFSIKDENMQPQETEAVRDHAWRLLQERYPKSCFPDRQTAEAENCQPAWFDCILPAQDMDIYNLMFFVSVNGKFLLGSFNCPAQDMDGWKDIFLQMLETVRICDRNKETESKTAL